VVVTLGVKGLKKSEVNLNSAPFNVNLGQYLAQKTNDLHKRIVGSGDENEND